MNKNGASAGKGWALLTVAGTMEPLWVVAMKLSEGFTDLFWAVVTVIFLALSMYLLALAMKCKIPVGTAYSIWVGIGAIGSLIAGIILFDEPSDLLRMGFVLLIVVGIVGLQLTGGEEGC
ncbi:DMT family transporter [Methanomassiliicoccus luminyensis]|uniref:DMT family transporter n=1 Tax=Methanomassiliicoccus luminyensis TaxID=1080712 RepID=UPI001F3FDF42|nr:multidrug efflux SMR transporter [Methanomassiliicoccus luminyensis]